MAFNLGFGSTPIGATPNANASQLQQLLAQIQSQQAAGQAPTQLGQMQALTGASPGGGATGLPPNSAGAMQGGPSAMPGNPGAMSPGQMLQQPAQGMPNMGGASWPGMNGQAPAADATSYPGQGSPMAQLPGTMNPDLVTSGLGLMSLLTGNSSKNKAAAATQTPSAQSHVMMTGQNGALQRLLSGYGPASMSGLMGAYGG